MSFGNLAWNFSYATAPYTFNNMFYPMQTFGCFNPFSFNMPIFSVGDCIFNNNFSFINQPAFGQNFAANTNFNLPYSFNSNFVFNFPMQTSTMFSNTQPNLFITTPRAKSSHSSKGTLPKFATLSRDEALRVAADSTALEKLNGGTGWRVHTGSFINDIPYAKAGTSEILTKVSSLIGEELVITSALGTKDSPHAKNGGDCSHYNANNPKLDFGNCRTEAEAKALKAKLESTGYFSHILAENNNGVWHLDVQIKDSAYSSLNTLA